MSRAISASRFFNESGSAKKRLQASSAARVFRDRLRHGAHRERLLVQALALALGALVDLEPLDPRVEHVVLRRCARARRSIRPRRSAGRCRSTPGTSPAWSCTRRDADRARGSCGRTERQARLVEKIWVSRPPGPRARRPCRSRAFCTGAARGVFLLRAERLDSPTGSSIVCSLKRSCAGKAGRQRLPSTRRCQALRERPFREIEVASLAVRRPAAPAGRSSGRNRSSGSWRLRPRSAARSARRSRGSTACRASRTRGAGSDGPRSACRPWTCARRGSCAARSPPWAGCRRSRRRPGARPLHELARVRVQRLEVAALPSLNTMSKASVDLPDPRDAGDDREAPARDLDVDVLKVVLARVDADRRAEVTGGRLSLAENGGVTPSTRDIAQRARRCTTRVRCLRSSGSVPRTHDLAAGLAALGAEVDDPVGRAR